MRLEERLASWTPRRPSQAVERRLFGDRLRPSGQPLAWAWLSPVAACLLLIAVLGQTRGVPPGIPISGSQPMVAMILSNQSYAAYLPGSFQRNQNRWDTFEWTNPGHFNSSEGPFLPGTQRMNTQHGQD